MDNQNTIGKILKTRRLELGLTLEQVGDSVGVGKSTVRKWETGAIENMKRDKIAKLASVLRISPAVIMGWDIETARTDTAEGLDERERMFNALSPEGQARAMSYLRFLTEEAGKK